ncbi:MAG: RNA 2',3'-cyclic phosphodiesterase [Gemmataceae bacterium]
MFVAVAMTAEVQRQSEELQRSLTTAGVQAKWVEPDSMHITLAFLGDLDDREIPVLFKALRGAAKRIAPFTLQVAGVGAFPNMRRPKIAWAGIQEGSDELIKLYDTVAASLESTDLYNREDRGYRPHLTLGRVKAEEDSATLATAMANHATWVGGRVPVERIALYSSVMQRSGPEYTVMGQVDLTGKS